MITRFAPSPTGYLHLGHARAAHEAFDFAARHGGECILRIEDIDHTRCKAEYIDAIYEDLNWLGFAWPESVRVQSGHINDYLKILELLKTRGLIYPCGKTRAELKADMATRGLNVYTRNAQEGLPELDCEPMAWRLSMTACRRVLGDELEALGYWELDDHDAQQWQEARAEQFGDVVIGRKDIGVSYHLAVTHDDALQGVTHIVRGQDLQEQTGIHVLLQRLMGWPTPIYRHHALVLRGDGQKLAKRDKDPSIRSKRENGMVPDDIWRFVL